MASQNPIIDNISPVGDEKLGSQEFLEAGSLSDGKQRPAHYVEIDEAASARLRRKLDLRLLPIITLVNLLSFVDRANIGNARVAGLDKELGRGWHIQIPVRINTYKISSSFRVRLSVYPGVFLCVPFLPLTD